MRRLMGFVSLLSVFASSTALASMDEADVAFKAYHGGYESLGIPAWEDLCAEARTVQDARELASRIVSAAVEAGDVDAAEVDDIFEFGVEITIWTVLCTAA